jgi:DNA modification methylase
LEYRRDEERETLQVSEYTILTGDCRTMLATLPAESVHCCVTSPPYYGLRDYQVDGQIGLEQTPDAYVAELVAVFREVRRVLRPDGCLWLNLGDSYNGSGGAGGDYSAGGLKEGQPRYPGRNVQTLKPKDLIGIPWHVAFALQADGWWLRSDVIWAKPNPMPESVTDRPTKAHEYVFLLTKSSTYFYDAQAIAEPSLNAGVVVTNNNEKNGQMGKYGATRGGFLKPEGVTVAATRNRRSVWSISTKPYKESHFATMPPEIPDLCIRAGTSAHGCCATCGAPWQRIVNREQVGERDDTGRTHSMASQRNGKTPVPERGWQTITTTTGWKPSCTCEADVTPCTVLDPFTGSGTTGAVAISLGRNFIGCELNPEYVTLANRRISAAQPALFGI